MKITKQKDMKIYDKCPKKFETKENFMNEYLTHFASVLTDIGGILKKTRDIKGYKFYKENDEQTAITNLKDLKEYLQLELDLLQKELNELEIK